ncbi:MAG: N-acyl-D-glucosamine 2-epimerase [Pedobacter sp.]|nr:MAG: N-acyl-D-glucosamine 2-epimerase [Pedobacter sp.]
MTDRISGHGSITGLAEEFRIELDHILSYWHRKSMDHKNGGFLGQIGGDEVVMDKADKGSVLNARILWTFSAAYNLNKDPLDLEVAKRSFEYFRAHFIDAGYGGVYWTLDYTGKALDTKKQIYALSFAVYGLSEFYKATFDDEALQLAKDLFFEIEDHSYDLVNGGYLEAFSRNWEEIGDLRLSEKDENEKKTMNTHLHILEAYTNLYHIWPNEKLKTQIVNLISGFSKHIVNDEHHLNLFFDEFWVSKSKVISYGHDIEAAWLLQEAALSISDEQLIAETKLLAVKIAYAASEGVDDDGMIYEYNPDTDHLVDEKHWWVQAEAIVGFFNAWQLTNDEFFLNLCIKIWKYTKAYIVDGHHGEWFWGRNKDFSLMDGQDKIGLWKCPYHNSRACIEMIRRIQGSE